MSEISRKKKLIYFLVAVAIVGFLDALYLSVKAMQGLPPPCSLLQGCEVVTLSKFSRIGGIPIALFGAVNYALVLVLLLSLATRWRAKVMALVFFLTTADFLVSLGLVYIQFFVLRAVCLYCMLSATVSTLLFLGTAFLYVRKLQNQNTVVGDSL